MSLKGLKCIVAAATAAMDGEAVESGARPVTIVSTTGQVATSRCCNGGRGGTSASDRAGTKTSTVFHSHCAPNTRPADWPTFLSPSLQRSVRVRPQEHSGIYDGSILLANTSDGAAYTELEPLCRGRILTCLNTLRLTNLRKTNVDLR